MFFVFVMSDPPVLKPGRFVALGADDFSAPEGTEPVVGEGPEFELHAAASTSPQLATITAARFNFYSSALGPLSTVLGRIPRFG